MKKFTSRKLFIEKLKELDKMKASYNVDMVEMVIWDIELRDCVEELIVGKYNTRKDSVEILKK